MFSTVVKLQTTTTTTSVSSDCELKVCPTRRVYIPVYIQVYSDGLSRNPRPWSSTDSIVHTSRFILVRTSPQTTDQRTINFYLFVAVICILWMRLTYTHTHVREIIKKKNFSANGVTLVDRLRSVVIVTCLTGHLHLAFILLWRWQNETQNKNPPAFRLYTRKCSMRDPLPFSTHQQTISDVWYIILSFRK